MFFHTFVGKAAAVQKEEAPVLPPIDSVKDPDFFNRLQNEARKEFSKEKTSPKKVVTIREPLDEEALNLVKIKDILEKKNIELDELLIENNALKEELKDVKTRNKKLCHILANGESKYLHKNIV